VRRRLIPTAFVVAACASAGPPPGGAEDHAPPHLVRVSPDTNAVNVGAKVATFYFDETINDRGTDAQDVTNMFLVSPSDGTPKVSYHRTRIDVRPRHGFRPNTAYTITLLPGLSDLRSNAMKTGVSVVFSTGPTIPTLRIAGTAFDWVAGTPVPKALIEATSPDSVVYLAQSDSLGKFTVGPLNPGSYLVRMTVDQNQNHRADRSESFDTLRVVAPHPVARQVRARRPGIPESLHQQLALGIGEPEREAEAPTRPADASQLACDGPVVVGVHDPVSRRNDVEGPVGVREPLGVAHVESHVQALLGGQATRGLDQPGGQVLARDVPARACGAQRNGAGASGQIEPAVPRPRIEACDELVVHREEVALRDFVPRGGPPDAGLVGLQRGQGCHVRRASSEMLVTPYFCVALSARSDTNRYSGFSRQVSISKPAASIAAR